VVSGYSSISEDWRSRCMLICDVCPGVWLGMWQSQSTPRIYFTSRLCQSFYTSKTDYKRRSSSYTCLTWYIGNLILRIVANCFTLDDISLDSCCC